MQNAERRQIRERFPLPKVLAMRTLQLDAFVKPEVSPSTRAMDNQLAILQTHTLAPLTSVLEAQVKGESLEGKNMFQPGTTAVELVGNVNAHLTHLCREQVVNDLNKSLLPVIEDDENFKDAPPLLLGTEFAKRRKHMLTK